MKSKREVKPTRARRVTHRFPSRKMNSVMVIEEWIDHAFCFECEYDSGISKYSPQPFQLLLVHDDWVPNSSSDVVLKRYTPDFVAHHSNGRTVVVECKPERHVSEFEAEDQSLLKDLPGIGLEFRIYSSLAAKSLRVQNLKILYPCALSETNLGLRKQLLKVVDRVELITIAGVIDSFPDKAAALREQYALMFEGHVVVHP